MHIDVLQGELENTLHGLENTLHELENTWKTLGKPEAGWENTWKTLGKHLSLKIL